MKDRLEQRDSSASRSGDLTGFEAIATLENRRTLAEFFQEQASWRERVFVTAGIRRDVTDGLGARLHAVVLPSASLAWDLGRETYFPRGFVSDLRLRAAWGKATRIASLMSPFAGLPVAGRNPELTRELELGLDAAVLDGRVSLGITRYTRMTTGALVPFPAPSSVSTEVGLNAGQVRNTGVEGTVEALVLERGSLRWHVGVSAAHSHNNVDDLGRFPLQIGGPQWDATGEPLGVFLVRPVLSVQDLDGDGVVTLGRCPGATADEFGPGCEIQLGEATFVGSPIPTTIVALSSRLDIGRRVAIAGVLDHAGGAKQFDFTDLFRCFFGVCQADFDATTSMLAQARAQVALLGDPNNPTSLDVVDASFWRLRELSVTVSSPPAWAARLGASSLSLTLAGRNLALWSDYRGMDPEVTGPSGGGLGRADVFTQPLSREYTARVNVAW